ncbi:MAG: HD domain-containing protein, partial [Acidobacteria bacterium]|nr:HD domain-containing protein [Acidobacteriota bacterium]
MIAGGEFLTNNDKPTQRVRCPVHGFIRYSANERKIIDHPAFQRLRHIRQLAMTYLVYPGAMHSRFEHSLGVMELATQAFDLLALRYPERLENELKQIPELGDGTMAKARQIVRLMALLHDVGHPAFSHAAETTIPQTCANREDLRRCNGRSFASNTNQSTGIGGPHSMNRSGNLVYSDDPC